MTRNIIIIFGDVCSSSYNLVLVAFCLSALVSVKRTAKRRRARKGREGKREEKDKGGIGTGRGTR